MGTNSAWPVPALEDRTSQGLARAVTAAIADGRLPEGHRLPPVRTVAALTGLSPSTVSSAWGLLTRAGAIRTDGRRGTTVAPPRPGPTRYRRALPVSPAFELDLSTGVPDPELLPDLVPSLAQLPRAWHAGSYLDAPVLPDLAEALRADWPYPPPALAVVDGALDGVDLVASALVRYGDRVVVEHPSFPPLLDLLDALGARVVGVPVDDDGLLPDALAAALEARTRAVFLQPRAHNPTGVAMTAARAERLAAVVAATEAMVVEDDSAGAISAEAAVSLGSWLPARTVHVRSFSKSHGPDLRVAGVSAPEDLLERVNERRRLGQGWTSRLLQTLLLDALGRPAARRQVEQARAVYAERRAAVVAGLHRRGIATVGRDGINLWVPVRDEAAALVQLTSRGIGAAAGTPFTTLPSPPHLRVTVGLVRDDFAGVADALADAAVAGPWAGPR